MKAFKNRLEEMAESALRLSLQAEKETLKEYEDSGDEPKKCKSVTVII